LAAVRRIGELLVGAGLVSEAQLTEALAAQQHTSQRIGEVLVERGFVGELELTQVLSNQLSVAWVSLDHVDFTAEILLLVPAPVARQFRLLPVFFRVDKKREKILYLAMDDPTDVPAMQRVSEITQMRIRPLIAPPTEIRLALNKHYPELR
jgi:type IV pilus assembly protein PilB